MGRTVQFLAGALAITAASADTYSVPATVSKIGQPLDSFVSYSLEFASFPEFAGNNTLPNEFSYNLLRNLGGVMGSNPYIRVGGNTQDYALFNGSQKEALIGIVDPNRSPDYPTTITIGPAYFESYSTWPGFKYSHGLNLGLGSNRSAGWQTLVETVPLACKALGDGRLYTWEYGNEPDLYGVSAQGPIRPPSWNEGSYVRQWLNGTKEIRARVKQSCPDLGDPEHMAPSFAALANPLKEPKTYISGATSPGVTLQGTLMNFGVTKASVDNHVKSYDSIFGSTANASAPPLIFGETNSLYNQGRPGLSNTFGASLWGINFNLYSASVGFNRYQAWQPVDTEKATKGTKAPYYGSMAVAAMLRNSATRPVSVSNIALGTDQYEAAYAAHFTNGEKLARLMVLNMHGYNTTEDGAGLVPVPNPAVRTMRTYSFHVGTQVADGQLVRIQRLMANGSDAITGITYDGWSYNWELDAGRPVRLHNVTTGETTMVRNGLVTVTLPDSSAALLSFTRQCR